MGTGASTQADETCRTINGTLARMEVAADRTRRLNRQLDRADEMLSRMLIDIRVVYRLPSEPPFIAHATLAPHDIVSTAAVNVRFLKELVQQTKHSVDMAAVDGAHAHLLGSVWDLKHSLDDSMQRFNRLAALGAVAVCGIP